MFVSSGVFFNDKEWIAVDANPSSPFRDRIYVTFTRFLFNPINGFYAQSPIMLAISTDGGATFSDPKIVGARVHLNPLAVTVALMAWYLLWGGAGLILAVPITAGMKAVFDNIPSWKGLGRLLGD